MGLSEIKVILETLQRACTEAENDGKRDIVSVLSKPEFINSLRQLWAHIPSKTRKSIGRRPVKGLRSSRKRLKAPNQSRITVPRAFTAKLHLWESDPLLFFTEDSGISLDLGRDSLAGSYNYISRLERRTETDTIRLRLWKVTYHRLKERLCLNYLRTDNMETVAQIISRSGMTEDASDLIKQRVSRWTDEGKRIDTLCRDINRADSLDDSHLGILFCLPQDIPDELIRALPLTGPDREEEIRLLKDRGISQVDGKERLENLAKSIFNLLWERMESAISRLHISELGYTVISPVHSPPGLETTTENGGATYQNPASLSLQINAESAQPEFCLQNSRPMVGADSTFNLFENVEPLRTVHGLQNSHAIVEADSTFNLFEDVDPLRTVHGLQSSHAMVEADSTFDLFENVEPLRTVHGLQNSHPIVEADSTFNLFENIEPLRMVHGLQSSYSMAGVDSTFNMFEHGEPPQALHGLQGSFDFDENIQPLQQPFSDSLHDDHLVAESSQSNWSQNTSCQQLLLPVSVP
ncbi:hypothetical protein N7497_001087 [Penicillium chrysogenum]|nr:hypothetical protein N7497_001087 [Penicillium chrysogenum]